MRRSRVATVLAAVMVMVAPVAGATPAAAVVATTVGGTLAVDPGAGVGSVLAHLDCGAVPTALVGALGADGGPFEFDVTTSSTATCRLNVIVLGNGEWSLDGWYVDEGTTGRLGLDSEATVITVHPGDTLSLPPITVSRAVLTVDVADSAGRDLGSSLDPASAVVLRGAGSLDPTDATGSGGSLSLLPGSTYLVDANRAPRESPYTGRYYAGDGALGAASAAAATTVSLAAGEARTVSVRLDGCATVSGTVAGGADLTDRTVTVANPSDPDLVTRLGTVAADGSFTVRGLLPGDYYVWASAVASATSSQVTGPYYRGADPAADAAPLHLSGCTATAAGLVLELPGLSGVISQTPVRVRDDRAVPPDAPRCVQVAGTAGVPESAAGAVLNVTTDGPTGPGYVVVYPDSSGTGNTAPPRGSTVNFEVGASVANAAFVRLPDDGKLCYATRGPSTVRIILDVTGYMMSGSGITTQVSQRLLDTRLATHVGQLAGALDPRQVYTVDVAGHAGVPSDATGVLVNVTVVGATALGHLRVFPGGAAVPNASTVNYAPGQTKANATVVSLSAAGAISLYSVTSTRVDVILDVVGWVSAGGAYAPITPTRVIDSRPGSGRTNLEGPLTGRIPYQVDLGGAAGIPADATAVVLNVTAVHPTALGNLRVYPLAFNGDDTPPYASSVNYIPGRDIPNLVVVGMQPHSTVVFYSDTSGSVNVIADVVGYLTAP
ncbi:hypothetical protein Q6348_15215 [Isoptericola sp. b441]|uniref:Alpha-amylase n=1 Tax=Actinotalea lenta TaxID=3064654 RepID=A0ABT9DD86_9CELL|nr:hypothetical protein [Isoptericola sp. b441]MDO8108546.1 hypothetical protein [Isoptericola sp. b441]